jgi:hypothetical protein
VALFELLNVDPRKDPMDILKQAQEQAQALGSTSQKLFEESVLHAQEIALSVGISGKALVDALSDLPKTGAELAQEMPRVATRISRAGLRPGDPLRSDPEIMALFNKIPGSSKLGAKESNIRQFLADKHASHIMSRHHGGGHHSKNIVWELRTWNLARGSRDMTMTERLWIRVYNAVDSIRVNSGTIARLGITTLGVAVISQTCVTAIAYALDLSRGEITVEEFRDRVIESAQQAGLATVIVFPILITVIALVPELTVLLTIPGVAAGFNLLFGASLAVPILESVIRHIEAEGFGEEVSLYYQDLKQGLQQWIKISTTERG